MGALGPSIEDSRPRERSRFQKGGIVAMRQQEVLEASQSSMWRKLSTLWGGSDEPDPVALRKKLEPYYSGHPQERTIGRMMRKLTSMPWRLVCMRFNDHPLQLAHNEVICKEEWMNGTDGIEYIIAVVMGDVFRRRRSSSKSKDMKASRSRKS